MSVNKKYKLINNIYHDHTNEAGLSSKNKVYKAAKTCNPSIAYKDVSECLQGNDVYTLFKPNRKKYETNKTTAPCLDNIWQSDLSDMSHIKSYNKGITFLMFVIDVYSRYLWVKPLISKSPIHTAKALSEIFTKDARVPGYIITDKGTEFTGHRFQNILKNFGVGFLVANSVHKSSMAERVQRTIKSRMTKYFKLNNTFKYIDVLQDLVDCYNNSIHRMIDNKPSNVVHNNINICEKPCSQFTSVNPVYSEGDYVRISLVKTIFAKGYEQSWSSEIFIVSQIIKQKNCKIMYKLTDLMGEAIEGRFYREELQKINYKDNKPFVIEKIIKRYLNEKGVPYVLVKWQGWPCKFNSSIPASYLKSI